MLVRQGQLVEILYFPAEAGGPDDPENTGFITPAAAEVRTRGDRPRSAATSNTVWPTGWKWCPSMTVTAWSPTA